MKHKHSRSAGQAHKEAQLCAQVGRVIALALADSENARLQRLSVHSVVPGADGARLVVSVVPSGPVSIEDLENLYEALEGARPWLRREVAAEINRKKTPELSFQVLPPWEAEG